MSEFGVTNARIYSIIIWFVSVCLCVCVLARSPFSTCEPCEYAIVYQMDWKEFWVEGSFSLYQHIFIWLSMFYIPHFSASASTTLLNSQLDGVLLLAATFFLSSSFDILYLFVYLGMNPIQENSSFFFILPPKYSGILESTYISILSAFINNQFGSRTGINPIQSNEQLSLK